MLFCRKTRFSTVSAASLVIGGAAFSPDGRKRNYAKIEAAQADYFNGKRMKNTGFSATVNHLSGKIHKPEKFLCTTSPNRIFPA